MILPAAVTYLGRLAAAGSSKGVTHIAGVVAGLTDDLVDAIHVLEHAPARGARGGPMSPPRPASSWTR